MEKEIPGLTSTGFWPFPLEDELPLYPAEDEDFVDEIPIPVEDGFNDPT